MEVLPGEMSDKKLPLKIVGVFGGSFDPVHVGHLVSATEVRNQLKANEMRLLPCFLPVHKSATSASANHRIQMLNIALTQFPGLSIDSREIEQQKACYTINTLQQMRSELGLTISLVFVIGWDSLQTINQWYRWQELLDYANIAVVMRPSFSLELELEIEDWLTRHEVSSSLISERASGCVVRLQTTQVDAASRVLRQSLGQSDCSVKGFEISESNNKVILPEIEHYIREHGLYGTKQNSKLN